MAWKYVKVDKGRQMQCLGIIGKEIRMNTIKIYFETESTRLGSGQDLGRGRWISQVSGMNKWWYN